MVKDIRRRGYESTASGQQATTRCFRAHEFQSNQTIDARHMRESKVR